MMFDQLTLAKWCLTNLLKFYEFQSGLVLLFVLFTSNFVVFHLKTVSSRMCEHPLTQPKKVFVNFNPGDGFQSGHFAGGSAGLPGHRKNVNIVRFFKAIHDCLWTRIPLSGGKLSTVDLLMEQWVETNPSNICIFPMDICFYCRLMVLRKWLLQMLTAFADVKYGCCQMLDGLVSTHPEWNRTL
jgi:hypothetical protein